MTSDIIRYVTTLLLGAVFIVAGCGRGPSEEESDEIVLYHQLRSKVQVLDPANMGDTVSHAVAAEFLECLYQYHYLKRPYEIIPQLADGMPQISEDGLRYIIRVKKGVYFQDDECFEGGKGRELKAGDFVYSWKRLADIKTRAKMWWVLDDKIVGLDEFREYSKGVVKGAEVDYSREVEGLRAIDDHTFVIKLKRPWPQLMDVLAFFPTAAVAKEAVDRYGKGIGNHPVGTGPFKLKIWHKGSYIEAVRNANFREEFYPREGEAGDLEKGLLEDAGKVLPFVDKIIWRVVVEGQPRWLMFMDGDIDITSIPKDNFGQAVAPGGGLTAEMAEKNIQIVSFQEPDTYFLGFNMEDPVLNKNKPLRLAMSYAIDREKWIELFFNGRGVVAHGFIPPNMVGYDPNIKEISKSEYNVEKAKKYLAQAEELNGGPLPSFKLTVGGTDTTYRQMGQFLQMLLENIGLDVEAVYLDWPTFLEKLRTKGVQLFMAGWIADYPDVENFLQIYYSKNAPWPNSRNYSNQEFDEIYEKAAVMFDGPERRELYRKAERIVVEDVQCAFIYHRIWYAMHHEWIKNFKPDAYKSESCGYGLSKYYRVDTSKRAIYKSR